MKISQPTCKGDGNFPSHNMNFTIWEKLKRDEGWTTSICHCLLLYFFKTVSASGFPKHFDGTVYLNGRIQDTRQDFCPGCLQKKEGWMTEWIRIITLTTQGTQIWTIITVIRSTTQSAKKGLRHTLKLNCNNIYRHCISDSVPVCSRKRICTLSAIPKKVLRNRYVANT